MSKGRLRPRILADFATAARAIVLSSAVVGLSMWGFAGVME